MLGLQRPCTSRDAQHQAQRQLVDAAREEEMFMNFEQQQLQVFNINKNKLIINILIKRGIIESFFCCIMILKFWLRFVMLTHFIAYISLLDY